MADQGNRIDIGSLIATLGLDTGNLTGDISQAQAALDALKRKMEEVVSAFGRGEVSEQSYADQLSELTRVQAEMIASLTAAAAANQAAAAQAEAAAAAAMQQAEAAQQAAAAANQQAAAVQQQVTAHNAAAAAANQQAAALSDLAHQVELEAMAIQNEIATRQHATAEIAADLQHRAEMEAAAIQNEIAMREKAAAEGAAAIKHQAEMEAEAIAHEIQMFQHEQAAVEAVAAAKVRAQEQFTQTHVAQAELKDINEAIDAMWIYQDVLPKATKASKEFAEEQERMKTKARAASMAMMQFGYVVDDIQYGFRSIVNNISPLAYNMSLAAGASFDAATKIATGVQIASVAAFQLYDNWDQLMEKMGLGKIRTEAEEMEELGKKTAKTAEETAKYNKYKKEQHDIQEMLIKQSKEQKDRANEIGEAYTEHGNERATGFEQVVAGIAQVNQNRGAGEHMTPDEEQELKNLRGMDPNKPFGNSSQETEAERARLTGRGWWGRLWEGLFVAPQAEEHRTASAVLAEREQQIGERLNDADVEKAKQLAIQAQNDPTKLEELITLVESHPEAFPPGLLHDLINQRPANRKQQAEWEAQGQANAKDIMVKVGEDKKEARSETKDRGQRVDELAREMLHGNGLAASLGGNLNSKEIEEKLKTLGLSPEEAADLAPDVSASVREETDKKVRTFAVQHGISPDAARQEMADDAQRQVNEDAAKRAERVAPGIGRLAQGGVAQAMLMGGGPETIDALRAQIAEALRKADAADKKTDLTEEQIAAATEGIIDKAREHVGNAVSREMLKGDQEKPTKSEQFNAMDLAAKVQAGVGGDETKKQTNLQQEMVRLLADMANKEKGGFITIK